MNLSDSSNNSFGEFLSALRKSRGYSNVSEYLRRYSLNISGVHYRQLESGERNISIESAKQLCSTLNADPKTFYFNLLRDWLPAEIMQYLVPLSDNDPDVLLAYRNAILQSASQVLYPDDQCCDFLMKHFEFMPIVWFIYSQPIVTLSEIGKLAQRCNISMPANALIDEFVRLGLVELVSDSSDCFRRFKPVVSFSHHPLGKTILAYEAKQFEDNICRQEGLCSDSVVACSLIAITPEARQTMFRRIQEFERDVRNAAEDDYLSSEEVSEAVFYSVLFAPRR